MISTAVFPPLTERMDIIGQNGNDGLHYGMIYSPEPQPLPDFTFPSPMEKVLANAKQIGGSHYKDMGVQPWDVVDTWPIEQQIGYYRGGALKYVMRMGSKDESLQEIEKGIHFLEKLVEVLKKHAGS